MFRRKSVSRIGSLILCIFMLFGMIPQGVFADDLDTRTLEEIVFGSEGEEPPTFDYLYDDESVVKDIDFSSKRLLVKTDDIDIFTHDTKVLSEYMGVYLIEFETVDETKSAYTYYLPLAETVEADVSFSLCDDEFIGSSSYDDVNHMDDAMSMLHALLEQEEVEKEKAEEEEKVSVKPEQYDIALIDTGVKEGALKSVSLIDENLSDENGHGTKLFSSMKELREDVKVLSIKAFGKKGEGSLSSIYAAVQYAIAKHASVIVLPFTADLKDHPSSLLIDVLKDAVDAGIKVVVAAGNDGKDVKDYVPANIKGVYVAGSCDASGIILPTSNFGENVFCNIAASSTSEAAAKLAVLFSEYDEVYIKTLFGKGLVFDVNGTKDESVSDNDSSVVIDDKEYEVHDKLVEVEASDDDPILSYDVFSDDVKGLLEGDTEDEEESEDPGITQDPVTVDNQTIERITVRWLSTSTGETTAAGFNRLQLKPEGTAVGNQQFQIDFALSGQDTHDIGTIEIVIPAYIWLDRDQHEPGELTLSVPEDPALGAEFVWTRVDDYIVLKNAKPMSAASKVLIQGTFRNVYAPDMVDGTISNGFNAVISLTTKQGNTISMISNSIDASIDTFAEVSSVSKTAWNTAKYEYDVWWETVPSILPASLRPDNENDYVYVRWYVSSTARGNQPYTMEVYDKVADEYEGIMLGVTGAAEGTNGVVKSLDQETVRAVIYCGYSDSVKTTYVWTAYPKSAFSEGEKVTLHNEQTTYVTEQDNPENITEMTAKAEFETKSPTIYTFIKHWDDNDNEAGHRPQTLTLYIRRDGKTYKTVPMTKAMAEGENENDWTYRWSDEGKIGKFTVSEYISADSGTYDEKYDDKLHKDEWKYWLTRSDYDEDTHTFHYTNTYREGWAIYTISKLSKAIEYKYTDSDLVSTRDNLSLNALTRKESVEILYPLKTTLSTGLISVEGGAKPNLFVLEDAEYKLNGQVLTEEDIDIARVVLSQPTAHDYVKRSDEEHYYDTEPADVSRAVVYGYINGNYEEMAYLDGDALTGVYEGVTVSGLTVRFPENVTRVKFSVLSDSAIVDLSYTMILRVKPSETVLNMIEDAFAAGDYIRFPVWNKANSYIEYAGSDTISFKDDTLRPGDHILDMDVSINGYMHGRLFKVAAVLDKKFKLIESDSLKRSLQIRSTLTLRQQSNVINKTEYIDAVANGEIPNTMSGTYYDLLPKGVYPDVNSVKVSGGDTIRDVYTVENYRDSGRVLLVVKVNNTSTMTYVSKREYNYTSYPQAGYKNEHTLEFDSYCSWDVAQESSLSSMRNTAVYEADEDIIGNVFDWSGHPDDPLYRDENGNAPHILAVTAVGADASYMTGLDNNRKDPSFVYAGSNLDYDEIDIRAITGLEKHVKAADGTDWSYGHEYNDVNVEEAGLYTYRLLVRSDVDTITKDIILIDSIENYIPHGTDKEEDINDLRWHGGLVSLDISDLIDKGVDAKVYYSTVKGLDVSRAAMNPDGESGVVINKLLTEMTEDGERVWSDKAPANMGDVTAIAIDARYMVAEDGEEPEDFELDSNENFVVYLNMRAPYDEVSDGELPWYFKGTDGTEHENNAHAFNAVQLDCLHRVLGKNTHEYVEFSYTKVGIYSKHIDVKKVWEDEDDADGKRPDSIEVALLANGAETGRTVTLSDENEWTDRFDRLMTHDENGNYIVYTFKETFDTAGEYKQITSRLVTDDGLLVTLTNYYTPEKIDIPVTKIWEDDNDNEDKTRPSSIIVKLYADGVYTGKQMTIRPDDDGNWSGIFTGLNKRAHGVDITYTIEEELVPDYKTTYDDFTITNSYYPYGDLAVYKDLVGETGKAEEVGEFTFTLLLQSKDGADLTEEYAYDIYHGNIVRESGMTRNGDEFMLQGGEYIVVKDIPSGAKYTVLEKASDGFVLLSSSNDEGTIKSGTMQEARFVNQYNAKGSAQIKVYKDLTGKPLTRYQFKFELRDDTGMVIRTAYNEGDGSVTFGRINYTEADDGQTFVYTVSEYIAGRGGYDYDMREYQVEVYVEDNGDGTMTPTIRYFDIDDVGREYPLDMAPVFENSYHALGTIQLRAWKSIKRDLQENEFAFELYDENMDIITTVGNDTEGNVLFPAFAYNETHIGQTYLYFARERRGDDEAIIYDNKMIGYKVVVYDNGDGTLSFDQTTFDATSIFVSHIDCEGEGCDDCHGLGLVLMQEYEIPEEGITPVFYNNLKDGSLSVTKFVDGDGDPNTEFRFKVKLIGDEIEDKEFDFDLSKAGRYTVRYDANGGEEDSVPADDIVYKAGTTVTLQMEPVPTKGRCEFLGWSLERPSRDFESLDNAIQNGVEFVTEFVIEDDTTVYAVWTHNHGSVKANGRSGWNGSNPYGNMRWTLYEDGTLYFEPENGVIGSFDYYVNASGVPWYSYRSSVKSIESSGTIVLRYGRHFFSGCSNLVDLGNIGEWDTSHLSMLMGAFRGCSKLTDLSAISGWDVSGVSDMSELFYECTNLSDLSPLSDWDVSGITNMSSMFYKCTKLQDLSGIGAWRPVNLKNANSMFYSCEKLLSLSGVSDWNLSSITDMGSMFYACKSLSDITALNNWDVSNVTDMHRLFNYCSVLRDFSSLSEWNVSNVVYMGAMFAYSGLSNLDFLSNWETDSLTSAYDMFDHCSSITDLSPLRNFHMDKVTNMGSMFNNCRLIEDLSPLSSWNVESVARMSLLFSSCKSITNLDALQTWNIGSVTDMSSMFAYCENLVDISGIGFWDVSNVKNMSNMFSNCVNLYIGDFHNWDTSSVTNIDSIFAKIESMRTVILGSNFFASEKDIDLYIVDGSNNWKYTGLWVREELSDDLTVVGYTSAELREAFRADGESMAGTYVWQLTERGHEDVALNNIDMFSFDNSLIDSDGLNIDSFVQSSENIMSEDVVGMELDQVMAVGEDTDYNPSRNPEDHGGGYLVEWTDYTDYGSSISWCIFNDGTLYVIPTEGDVGLLSINGSLSSMAPPWNSVRSNITRIDCEGTIRCTYNSCRNLFKGCSLLTDIDGLQCWDFYGTCNFYGMFYGCKSLSDISILNNFVKSNVSDMTDMFYGCESVEDFSVLETWNVSSVSVMTGLFNGCKLLDDISFLSDWNVSKVTSMSGMFNGCSKLQSVDALSDWDVSKVTNFSTLFNKCSQLSDIAGLSSWDIGSAISLQYMFYDCGKLIDISPLAGWNVENVENMKYMFYNCYQLASIDCLESWNTLSLENIDNMFEICSSISDISALRNWTVDNITSMTKTFRNCYLISDLSPLENWNTEHVKSLNYTFQGCRNLSSVAPIGNWSVDNVTSLEYTFSSCGLITVAGLENWHTSNVSNIKGLFSTCSQLIDISSLNSWDLSGLKTIESAFSGCSSLKDISPLMNWDVSKVEKFDNLFYSCNSLEDMSPLSDWNTISLSSLNKTFMYCTSILDLSFLSKWNTDKLTTLDSTFYQCTGLVDIRSIGCWNTSSLKSMTYTFYGDYNILVADFSNWDTSNVTSASGVLYTDAGKKTSYLSEVTISPKFYNSSDSARITFAQPISNDIYTGYWVNELYKDDPDADVYTSEQLKTATLQYGDVVTWVWQEVPTTYGISFTSEESSGEMSPVSPKAVEEYILPNNAFQRFGYVFKGWEDNYGKQWLLNDEGKCIIPANAYSVGDNVVLTAIWEPVDTHVEMVDGEFEFTLRANETATFPDIPAGTAYQIYEETPDGWVLVDSVNGSGVIEPAKRTEADFTNMYAPEIAVAMIYGTKLLDGKAGTVDDKGNSFEFELVGEDGIVIETVSAKDGGFIEFTALDYETAGEYHYTVREKVVSRSENIQYDRHVEEITVVVADNSEGVLTATVQYDVDGVVFRNLTLPSNLTITKLAEGLNEANKDTEFTFRVKLYNESGVPVDGGSYPWYVVDNGVEAIEYADVDYSEVESEAVVLTVGEDGGIGEVQVSYDEMDGDTQESVVEIVSLNNEVMPVSEDYRPSRDPEDHGGGYIVEWTEYKSDRLKPSIQWCIFNDGTLYICPFDTNDEGYIQLESYYGSVRPWNDYLEDIIHVESDGKIVFGTSAYSLFKDCINLVDVKDLSNFDMSSVLDLGYAFGSCMSLVDVSGIKDWNVSNVTSFDHLFYSCDLLSDLIPVKDWHTDSLQKLTSAFYGCDLLSDLTPLHDWDVSNVTKYVESIFGYCTSLVSVDGLDGWNVSNFTSLYRLFYGCSSLKDLSALSEWSISNVETLGDLFCKCSSIETLSGLEKWDVGNVTTIRAMCCDCELLSDISALQTWTFKNLTTALEVFENCRSLGNLNGLSNWDMSKVTNIDSMFESCWDLSDISCLLDWDVSKITTMTDLFYSCRSLESLNGLDDWKTDSLRYMSKMFSNCRILSDISALKYWNVSNVWRAYNIFDGCNSLKDISCLGDWDTANMETVEYMFRGCKLSGTLDLHNWTISSSKFAYTCFDSLTEVSKVIVNPGVYVAAGSTFLTCYAPKNEKYTGKWVEERFKDDPNAETYSYADFSKVTKNANDICTFVWQEVPTKYTVSFVSDNSSGEMSSVYPVAAGSYELPKNVFSRFGYIFKGWVDNQRNRNGSHEFIVDSEGNVTIPANKYKAGDKVTLTAIWEIVKEDGAIYYQVTHMKQSDSNYELADLIQDKAVPGTTITPEVREYVGFSSPAPQEYVIPEDEVLYIVYLYDKYEYDIEFDGNGAEYGEMDAIHVLGNFGQTLPQCYYQKIGSMFVGWGTEPDGGEIYSAGQTVKNLGQNGETVKLYAQWLSIKDSADASNGEIIVTCKAGQTIVIPNLPAGTRYEVEEIGVPSGWQYQGGQNLSGTLGINETVSVSAYNVYSAKGSVSLSAHKNLVDGVLESGEFSFELLDSTMNPLDSKVNGDIELFDGSYMGTAPVYFDPVEFTVPGDYTYYIREVNDGEEGIIYDGAVYEVVVHVRDIDGIGILSTEVEYKTVSGDEPVFVNYLEDGSFTVYKTLQNGSDAANEIDFNFILSLMNASGIDPLTEQYKVVRSDGTESYVSHGGIVSIKGGDWFRVEGLPNGTQYEVVEVDKTGFTLLSSEGSKGTIVGGENADVYFTNVYSASGSVSLMASKLLVGRDLIDGEFGFRLIDENGIVLQTRYNNESGMIYFDPIDFSLEDAGKEFIYRIEEVIDEENGGVFYDNHSELIRVLVDDVDGNGELEVIPVYDEDEAVFINIAGFDLDVSKTVTGSMGSKDTAFTFVLTLENEQMDISDKLIIERDGERSEFELVDGMYQFTLTHGETVKFVGLPAGTLYSIEEVDTEYETGITVTKGDDVRSVSSKTVSGEVEDDTVIAYMNTKDGLLPTDATSSHMWLGVMFGLIVIGTVVVYRKKKARS